MRTFGVDVSHWEGSINWQAAAPGIGFAYFKCTDGVRFVDDQFDHNQRGCSDAGIPHAPYHYFQPSLDPVAQANHFINTAGKRFKRYILDVEAAERDLKITQKLHTFLDRVEKLTGSKPSIYTSPGYWNDFIQPKPPWAGEYDLIVAHYTCAHSPLLPIGWATYVIWQFSDNWNFAGCEENADGNWFNGNLENCRAWFGNYCSVEPPQPPSTGGLKLHSLFDNLHIRQSPNMQSKILGKLAQNEVVEIEQLGGNDVWVRHGRGWSAVERGGYRYMQVASFKREGVE
jgi:GH25 family lysozyme M1 (1,4-beta-N-acetylmuramidase)